MDIYGKSILGRQNSNYRSPRDNNACYLRMEEIRGNEEGVMGNQTRQVVANEGLGRTWVDLGTYSETVILMDLQKQETTAIIHVKRNGDLDHICIGGMDENGTSIGYILKAQAICDQLPEAREKSC